MTEFVDGKTNGANSIRSASNYLNITGISSHGIAGDEGDRKRCLRGYPLSVELCDQKVNRFLRHPRAIGAYGGQIPGAGQRAYESVESGYGALKRYGALTQFWRISFVWLRIR